MSKDKEDKSPVNLEHNEIRDSCEKMAKKFLPEVEDALQTLFELDPYKGILAWERVAEFAVAKKSKENLITPNANITINMIPATRDEPKTIDISDFQNDTEESNEEN